MVTNGRRHDYRVFAGNSNRRLAEQICQELGRSLSPAEVGRFSDGEIQIEIGENVRGLDTFVVQSTCPDANTNLMELLIMADALKRASAGSITAVMPYYGYARQDRKSASRVPITAKLVADLIEAAGVGRDDDDVLRVAVEALAHVLDEHRRGVQVVEGDGEEALDLPGVHVHGHDARDAGRLDEVRDELRGDRDARATFRSCRA